MSSLMASFVDGKLETQTASSQSISNKDKNDSGINSEAFLSLLVAEMQNQDPLEPTSNTEWISQYATFTEVSEIQDIANAMNAVKAQDLVGEYVIMKVTNAQGSTDFVSGQVDYVVYENDDTFLSINGELYSIADLDTVADQRYMDAYNLASQMAEDLKKLPGVDNLTLGYKADVTNIYETAQNMNDYEKSFLDKTVFDLIDSYYEKMQELVAAANTSDSSNEKSDNSEEASDDNSETDISSNIGNLENTSQADNTEKKTEASADNANPREVNGTNTGTSGSNV